ncbi:MAG: hypothetical protein HKL98_11040 [Burkholderiales bacterium]|nr:hypothetical protein [Burkholderiales bacterium]
MKLFHAAIFSAAVCSPLSALAGPDWEVIHMARHDLARREAIHQAHCLAKRPHVAQQGSEKLRKESKNPFGA